MSMLENWHNFQIWKIVLAIWLNEYNAHKFDQFNIFADLDGSQIILSTDLHDKISFQNFHFTLMLFRFRKFGFQMGIDCVSSECIVNVSKKPTTFRLQKRNILMEVI